MRSKKPKLSWPTVLGKKGMRATKRRLILLKFLEKQPAPLSVEKISKLLRQKMNMVTAYRALRRFEESGLVRQVIADGRFSYELVPGRFHRHHLVCRDCGEVEDLPFCPTPKIEELALKTSKRFSSVNWHALDLYGVCKDCA